MSHVTETLQDSAFVLQWEEAEAAQVVTTLVREHYQGIFRLARVMFQDPGRARDEAHAAIRLAAQSRAAFLGQTTPRAWLYGVLVQNSGKRHVLQASHDKITQNVLPVLTLLEDFSPEELAFTLSLPASEVETQLRAAHLTARAQNPRAEDLQRNLEEKFQLEQLTAEQVNEISQSILAQIHTQPGARPRAGRELIWVGLALLAIFLFFLRYRSGGSATQGQSLFPTPSPPLPTPLTAQTGAFDTNRSTNQEPIHIENKEPGISSDGQFIVFASNSPTLVPWDTNGQQDIFVYHRLSGVLELVSVSSNGIQSNARSFSPKISADGRWVTFVSRANNLAPAVQNSPDACRSNPSCANVFLHDRAKGTTFQISKSRAGQSGNGDSLYPSISGDGQKIVFWSAAGNLAEGLATTCEGGQSCLNVYIFDRITGDISSIPIGRNPKDTTGLRTLRISSDGNWIIVPVIASDHIESEIDLPNGINLLLYDLNLKVFSPINLSSEGIPGNASAFNANISGNGRFVAFASLANNLVNGDWNGKADAFLRDTERETTELASVDSLNAPGVGTSGTIFHRRGGFGDRIGLSADGTGLVFFSTASNFTDPSFPCASDPQLACNQIVYRNRKISQTRTLAAISSSQGFYLFPDISADGRWVTFMEQRFVCKKVCSDIWLYDLLSGESKIISREKPVNETPIWSQKAQINGHKEAIQSLAISPAGDLLASGSTDKTVKIWLMPEGRLAYTLAGHKNGLTNVAFAPHGKILASGDQDGMVILWQVSSSLGTWRFILDRHPGAVLDLSFSSDGKFLAVGTTQGFTIWELSAEKATRLQQLTPGPVNGLAFSPDNAFLATAQNDDSLWLRSVPEGDLLARLGPVNGPLTSPIWSRDGILLATGTGDKQVLIWNVSPDFLEGGQITVVKKFQQPGNVLDLAFSPIGRFLATLSSGEGLQLIDLASGTTPLLPSQLSSPQIVSAAYSLDGKYIAAGSTRGQIYLLSDSGSENSEIASSPLQFFVPQTYDQFSEQQIMLVENGVSYDSTTPLENQYSLSTREFSSLSGVYFQVPDILPPEAIYLGQVNSSVRIVSLLYDLPLSEFQDVRLTLHLPTGVGGAQVQHTDYPDRRVGAGAILERFSFGSPDQPEQIEAAFGGWAYFLNSDPFISKEDRWVVINWTVRWVDDPARMTLRWRHGNALFEIAVSPKEGLEINPETPLVTFAELLEIARSINARGTITSVDFDTR